MRRGPRHEGLELIREKASRITIDMLLPSFNPFSLSRVSRKIIGKTKTVYSPGDNMSWIRLGLTGVALVGIASVASAQAPEGPQGAGASPKQAAAQGERGRSGGRDARMVKRMFSGIELTAAQEKQRQQIMEKYNAERRALIPEGKEGRPDEATKAKMLDLMTKSQVDYRAILTPAQQAIFDKNVALIKERLEQRAKQEKDE